MGREAMGRQRDEASFPVPPSKAIVPSDYLTVLSEIKEHIQQTRLRTVLAANAAMTLMYWDIGQVILKRQADQGWGAKVIDRLSADLREAYPEMRGLSPRNLKYMRAFTAAWADRAIVQRVIAQIPWRQNIALLEQKELKGSLPIGCAGSAAGFYSTAAREATGITASTQLRFMAE
jgi:hypothetical protein